MKTIILASSSLRRKQLLEKLGIAFSVEPSNYKEDLTINLSPIELAKKMALGKTLDVAKKHTNAIIIGADTLIAFSGKVFGKPHTKERAHEMLTALNGKEHSVITAYTVIDADTGKTVTKAIESKVFFKKVTDEEILQYIETGEPLERAAAYAIQEKGAFLVEKFEGDYDTIVGLPIAELANTLKEFGVHTSKTT